MGRSATARPFGGSTLWHEYLSNPELWTPFGIGPRPAEAYISAHAHQQLLDTLAVGGWMGLAGVLAFVWLASRAAVRSAAWDGRAAIALVFAMAAIFQVDVVNYAASYASVNNPLVLIVVVVAATAGRSPVVAGGSAEAKRSAVPA